MGRTRPRGGFFFILDGYLPRTMSIMSDPVRIAAISLHTSPLDQPGTGDSGGMNVYVRSVAERLADRGVAVDVFTRCAGRGVPEVERVGPHTRIVQVNAGPCAPVAKDDLVGLLPRFEDGILSWAEAEGPYDLVHAHYWLSGRVGLEASARWRVPLVASFHTLGEVKNRALAATDEPAARLEAERDTIAGADRILVPTPAEFENLVRLYGAAPGRVRVVHPGVDAASFSPRPKEEARRRLGLSGRTVMLFLGRLQPLKGPDVAIRAAAKAMRRGLAPEAVLVVLGGPSGPGGRSYVGGLRDLAAREGMAVEFLDPRPHEELPWVYSAADVLLMPSRSESFGLAALEAQACSVPVVAASVGGLRHVVEDGVTGFLVEGHEPSLYAERLLQILGDPALAGELGRAGRRRAAAFGWDGATDGVLDVYTELLPDLTPASVA
jgi:D-inositol-3-phosphate glycosyltransferase